MPTMRGDVAQSGERLLCKQEVSGSIPLISTRPRAGGRTLTTAHRLCDLDQASKSIRWMPWRQEPMKDAASCDKPRGAASRPRSVDLRMGKPRTANPCDRTLNS